LQINSHGEAMTITQLKGYALSVGSGSRRMLGYWIGVGQMELVRTLYYIFHQFRKHYDFAS